MGKYFGTDGFRGDANVDLTAVHAFKIGLFLGWYYAKDPKMKRPADYRASVVVGKDTRLSSYMFEEALTAGLAASGAGASSSGACSGSASDAGQTFSACFSTAFSW